MKEKEMTDILLTGGGIIPDSDMKKLIELGCGSLFPPGTDTKEIIAYITDWVKANRN
jgi:methylmalonyl-CoA mutase C-terminal domain/subunit